MSWQVRELALCRGPFVEIPLDTDSRTQAREAMKAYLHAGQARHAAESGRTDDLAAWLRSEALWSEAPVEFKAAFRKAVSPFFASMCDSLRNRSPTRARGKMGAHAHAAFARDVFAAILPPVERVFFARGARKAAIRQAARQAADRFPDQAMDILRDTLEELWAVNEFHGLCSAERREVVRRLIVAGVVAYSAMALARNAADVRDRGTVDCMADSLTSAFGGARLLPRSARAASSAGAADQESVAAREDRRGAMFIDFLVEDVMRGFVSWSDESHPILTVQENLHASDAIVTRAGPRVGDQWAGQRIAPAMTQSSVAPDDGEGNVACDDTSECDHTSERDRSSKYATKRQT